MLGSNSSKQLFVEYFGFSGCGCAWQQAPQDIYSLSDFGALAV